MSNAISGEFYFFISAMLSGALLSGAAESAAVEPPLEPQPVSAASTMVKDSIIAHSFVFMGIPPCLV